MGIFESVNHKEILQLLKNFNKSVVDTGTTTPVGKIGFL